MSGMIIKETIGIIENKTANLILWLLKEGKARTRQQILQQVANDQDVEQALALLKQKKYIHWEGAIIKLTKSGKKFASVMHVHVNEKESPQTNQSEFLSKVPPVNQDGQGKLYYDEFRQQLAAGAFAPKDPLPDLTKKPTRRWASSIVAGTQELLSNLDQAKVYKLTKEAEDFIEIQARKTESMVPFEPVYPTMWIEFADGVFRNQKGDISRGVLIHPQTLENGYEVDFFYAGTEHIRTSFDSATSWRQKGACGHCVVMNSSTGILTSEVARVNRLACVCADSTCNSSTYISLLLQMLRGKGIEETVVYRESTGLERGQRYNGLAAPHWIKVSLSERQRIVYESSSRQQKHTQDHDTLDLPNYKTPVKEYIRILEPGPGKPWKKRHEIKVERHNRLVYGVAPTRIKVTI